MNRITTWLLLAIVLALALASWISALDANGNRAESSFLWAATAIAAALLVLRLVRRAY
jgi:fucose 4-O-acetylase-like acetyltransferase